MTASFRVAAVTLAGFLVPACGPVSPPVAPDVAPAGFGAAEAQAAAEAKEPAAASPPSKAGEEWVYSEPAGVWFTRSEITVDQYRACVNAGKCSSSGVTMPYWSNQEKPQLAKYCNWDKGDRGNHPMNCIDWNQAEAVCEWLGGRLPTGDEWFKEASNNGTRDFPWGNQQVNCDYAIWSQGGRGCGRDSTWPVCSKRKGDSVSGLCDMSGNLGEWTSTLEGNYRVLRGGSWNVGNPGGLRASDRVRNDPAYRYDGYGVRCARSPLVPPIKAGEEWVYSEPAGVWFTRSEITVDQYQECVSSGKCRKPRDKSDSKYCNWGYGDRGNHPINCIGYTEAIAVCAWLGGRLPTEDEWFKEASAGGTREFPWGKQQVTCDYAIWGRGGRGCGRDSTWPVCSKRKGDSVSGLCDMSGNVWEWTSIPEWTSAPEGNYRVVRGGSWYSLYPDLLRASYRRRIVSTSWSGNDVSGVRCARSPPVAPDVAPAGFGAAEAQAAAEAKEPAAASPLSKAGEEWVYSKPAGVEFTRSEITVDQYRACLNSGKCSKPRDRASSNYCNWGHGGRGNHPVNCVDWHQAKEVCEWLGGRLPTEDEWYKEASNNGTREYPWGKQQVTCDYAIWSQGGCGCGRHSTWPVCSKRKGDSVSGLCDMSGNVWEWTSTPEENYRVLRGGSLNVGNPGGLRASDRIRSDPAYRFDGYGVRCARSPPVAPDVAPAGFDAAEVQAAAAAKAAAEAEKQAAASSLEVWQPGTNLYWLRCPVGQTWTGSACSGTVKYMNWYEAMKSCPSGYRLPTRQEFVDLLGGCDAAVRAGKYGYCKKCYASATCKRMFVWHGGWFWSSSTAGSATAWLVVFAIGNVDDFIVSCDHSVRCVRTGP